MKSNVEMLRKRGWIDESDLEGMSNVSFIELLDWIDHPEASKRTAAVRLLGVKLGTDSQFITRILERLCVEQSLYTRYYCKNLREDVCQGNACADGGVSKW